MTTDPVQQTPSDPLRAGDAARRVAAWLLLSTIGGCALAILAAQTPPRFRLLGPFSLGLSLLTACLLEQAAAWTGLTARRTILLLGAVFIAAVPVGTTCLLHRQETAILAQKYRNAGIPIVANAPSTGEFQNPDAARQQVTMARKAQELVRQEREKALAELTTFSAFLKRRLANVERMTGEFAPAAAIAAWGTEMLLAIMGGMWMLWRMGPQPASNMDGDGSGG